MKNVQDSQREAEEPLDRMLEIVNSDEMLSGNPCEPM